MIWICDDGNPVMAVYMPGVEERKPEMETRDPPPYPYPLILPNGQMIFRDH